MSSFSQISLLLQCFLLMAFHSFPFVRLRMHVAYKTPLEDKSNGKTRRIFEIVAISWVLRGRGWG